MKPRVIGYKIQATIIRGALIGISERMYVGFSQKYGQYAVDLDC